MKKWHLRTTKTASVSLLSKKQNKTVNSSLPPSSQIARENQHQRLLLLLQLLHVPHALRMNMLKRSSLGSSLFSTMRARLLTLQDGKHWHRTMMTIPT